MLNGSARRPLALRRQQVGLLRIVGGLIAAFGGVLFAAALIGGL